MRASRSGTVPCEIDGALYVDGGLLQNLPVAAAQGSPAPLSWMDVGSGLLPRDQLNSALGISLQMINVLMAQNVQRSRSVARTRRRADRFPNSGTSVPPTCRVR